MSASGDYCLQGHRCNLGDVCRVSVFAEDVDDLDGCQVISDLVTWVNRLVTVTLLEQHDDPLLSHYICNFYDMVCWLTDLYCCTWNKCVMWVFVGEQSVPCVWPQSVPATLSGLHLHLSLLPGPCHVVQDAPVHFEVSHRQDTSIKSDLALIQCLHYRSFDTLKEQREKCKQEIQSLDKSVDKENMPPSGELAMKQQELESLNANILGNIKTINNIVMDVAHTIWLDKVTSSSNRHLFL